MNEQHLSTLEQNQLKSSEAIIEKTLGAFAKCGIELARIKDNRLYREKYGTFEEYVKVRWGFERNYAYRLIEAAEVKRDIEKVYPNGIQITNERQARALAVVPKESRARVYKQAVKTGDTTAAGIQKAAAQIVIRDAAPKPSKNDAVLVDETGYPIPNTVALEYWERSDEVKQVLDLINKAKSAVGDLLDTKDRLWHEAHIQSAHIDLKNAFRSMATAMPYAVCGYCQGQTTKTCTFCGGKGLVSKHAWNLIPEEIRDIRAKTMTKKVVPMEAKA